MLVFISDLHLTDGSSGATIGLQAFQKFHQHLWDMAYDASWRRVKDQEDGVYEASSSLTSSSWATSWT